MERKTCQEQSHEGKSVWSRCYKLTHLINDFALHESTYNLLYLWVQAVAETFYIFTVVVGMSAIYSRSADRFSLCCVQS